MKHTPKGCIPIRNRYVGLIGLVFYTPQISSGIGVISAKQEEIMTKPSDKSPRIEAFIADLTGQNRVETIQANACMTCDAIEVGFRDELSLIEYRIGGMCQECQDRTFGG